MHACSVSSVGGGTRSAHALKLQQPERLVAFCARARGTCRPQQDLDYRRALRPIHYSPLRLHGRAHGRSRWRWRMARCQGLRVWRRLAGYAQFALWLFVAVCGCLWLGMRNSLCGAGSRFCVARYGQSARGIVLSSGASAAEERGVNPLSPAIPMACHQTTGYVLLCHRRLKQGR